MLIVRRDATAGPLAGGAVRTDLPAAVRGSLA